MHAGRFRTLLRLSLVGFACRALIPVGFMPAALDEGGPITICHGGMAGAFFQALAARETEPRPHAAHHAEHAHTDAHGIVADEERASGDAAAHAAWERCAVGAAFAHAALPAQLDVALLGLDDVVERVEPRVTPPSFVAAPYRARAPPSLI